LILQEASNKFNKYIYIHIYQELTRSRGRKKADALDDLLPAFRATALPCQSITGEPLDPPLVPDAA